MAKLIKISLAATLFFLGLIVFIFYYFREDIHTPIAKATSPLLVEEGYKGYNIAKYNREFYGVSQAEGPLDIREIHSKAKFPWFADTSIVILKSKVDELVKTTKSSSGKGSPQALDSQSVDDSPPVLVEQGYKEFNIVKYGNEFYGVNQGEGPMDIREIKSKAKFPWFMDNSIVALKFKIDGLAEMAKSPSGTVLPRVGESSPVLVEQGYKGFNLVKYGDEFYGVNQGEGSLDIREITFQAKFPWFKDKSLDQVKFKISTQPLNIKK